MQVRKGFPFIVIAVFFFIFVSSCSNPVEVTDDPVEVLTQEANDALIDSLFEVLIERAQMLESVESYGEFHAIDFTSLSNGFAKAIVPEPSHVKGNVGYMVSTILSLNGNEKIKTLVDTLDTYRWEVENYDDDSDYLYKRSGKTNGMLAQSYNNYGIEGLGRALAVKTPQFVLSQVTAPKFPRYITLNYIQNIIEDDVMPVLDSVIASANRLENVQGMRLQFAVDRDAVEIDMGDIFLMDAALRLLRAGLGMYTTYDMDMYTSAQDRSYSWIDEIVKYSNEFSESDKEHYYISGDSLICKSGPDSATYNATMLMGNVFRYNMNRDNFLSIRRQNHMKVYEDLLAVPSLITRGLDSIRAEKDANQEDDLVPNISIISMEEEMIDFQKMLIDEGVSYNVASRFRTPETCAAFITELLQGPYQFDETVDGTHIAMNIDISAFFKNPVRDLRTILPMYKWKNESEWVYTESSDYTSYYMESSIHVYPGDTYNIPDSLISQIDRSDSYGTQIILKDEYYMVDRDIYFGSDGIIELIDDAGNVLDIETLIDQDVFFPYFRDYTFNGIFPEMTREKWIKLVYQQ